MHDDELMIQAASEYWCANYWVSVSVSVWMNWHGSFRFPDMGLLCWRLTLLMHMHLNWTGSGGFQTAECSSETRNKCRQGRRERREMREETKNTKAWVGRAADAGGNEATGQDGWIDGTRGRRGRSMDGSWIVVHTHAQRWAMRDDRDTDSSGLEEERGRAACVCSCLE
jgi:hypothetical protein